MRLECLICEIGKAQLAIPSERVLRVTEFDLSPPVPLAQPWLGGLTLNQGQILLCIRPLEGPRSEEPRGAVILDATGIPRCVIEVDRAKGIEWIEVDDRPFSSPSSRVPNAWFLTGTNEAGLDLIFVNLIALHEALGSSTLGRTTSLTETTAR